MIFFKNGRFFMYSYKIILAVFCVFGGLYAMDDQMIVHQIATVEQQIRHEKEALQDILVRQQQARALPNLSRFADQYELFRSNFVIRIQSLKTRRSWLFEQLQGYAGPR